MWESSGAYRSDFAGLPRFVSTREANASALTANILPLLADMAQRIELCCPILTISCGFTQGSIHPKLSRSSEATDERSYGGGASCRSQRRSFFISRMFSHGYGRASRAAKDSAVSRFCSFSACCLSLTSGKLPPLRDARPFEQAQGLNKTSGRSREVSTSNAAAL